MMTNTSKSPHILLIDKPVGISSFDVIRRLRPKLNIRKMGHAGTLDPLASGLMIIGVGEGTKKLTELTKLDKEYVTEILVGERTESGDQDGRVLEEREISEKEVAETFAKEKVSATLTSMIDTLTLPVSAFSAIKQDGVPFYKKARLAARQGEVIQESELPIREMKVYEAELLDIKYDAETKAVIIKARFHVGSGTYIRSLGEELGKRLGNYPARLESLRRTKVGEFKVEDAETI